MPNGKIIAYNSVMYMGGTSNNPSGLVGFTFRVTFDSSFSGKMWTLSGAESQSGIVPSNYYTEITVSTLNANFTLSCNGYSINISSGQYYGYLTTGLYPYNTTLDDNTWDIISKISSVGAAASIWNIGDYKQIALGGNIGHLSLNNYTIRLFIIGFNHNASREGNNRIHFQLGKSTSNTQIALCDNLYNSSVSSTGYFSMNSSNTNVGGWNATQMRNTILHSGYTPTDTGTSTLMAALPSELRAVMKSCVKYTDNTGGGVDNASYVTATTEYLPLLAEFEVFGIRTYANSTEQNYQMQYDYYKANAKIFYNHSNTGSAVVWWLRSPYYYHSDTFCIVNSNGTAGHYSAHYSYGVAPVLFI